MNVKNFFRYTAVILTALLIAFPVSCKFLFKEAPAIKLEIYEGPTLGDNVYYYRVRAIVTGNPAPEVEFSRDDSNGAWGEYIAQVNFYDPPGTYALIATATNSEGTATDSIEITCSSEDLYRLKCLEYLTIKGSDTYLSSLNLKEQSELFEKLYEINYPIENIHSLFKNIQQSIKYNDEESKVKLLSDPALINSEKFLPFYEVYASSKTEKELIYLIDNIYNLSYTDKFYLFKEFRNSNVLEIVDKIKSQDNQIYEDILSINKLGFFNISNFIKKEDIKEFISYIKEIKLIDRKLYKLYIKYNPESFYALQEISRYYDKNEILEYRPTPDSILELYNIISDIPEEYRLDYIENSFKSAHAVIVKGSEDFGEKSSLLYINMMKELNIPYSVITNNLNNIYAIKYINSISGSFDILSDIKKINDSLSGKEVRGIKTNVKTKNEFINILKDIIKDSNSEILNIFIITHGSGYDLYLGPDPSRKTQDYYYYIYSDDLISLFNNSNRDNKLFLDSCFSSKFANYFRDISNIKIVSPSDLTYWDGDLPYSILISMKSNDFRVEMEELMNISNEVNPDCEDEHSYHYFVDNFDYSVTDDKVSCNGKQGELDIKFINFDDESSILYYHVESLNNAEISNISPCKSCLIEEKTFLNKIIPFIDDLYNVEVYFPIFFNDIDNGIEDYDWYLNNLNENIISSNTWTYEDTITNTEKWGADIYALSDEYIIYFNFGEDYMYIFLYPINYNTLNNSRFSDIEGFIKSIISPKVNIDKYWSPCLEVNGYYQGELDNVFNYIEETLLENNITIRNGEIYSDNDQKHGNIFCKKDGVNP